MLTVERLMELLVYEPESGALKWISRPSKKVRIGDCAGCGATKRGEVLIRIDRVLYKAHRLAWLYMTGVWPADEIDHRDCDPSNNRWSNLREATREQNNFNVKKLSTNTSGFKGVSLHKASGLWQAYIWSKNRKVSLGYFREPAIAHAAYVSAAMRLRGDFARVS